MSLAQFYNFLDSRRAFEEFAFANQDHHNRIVQAISDQFNKQLPTYVLAPLPENDLRNWLLRHQDIHNQENLVLGIAGNDLTDIDFHDKNQMNSWLQLHATEHLLAANILRVF